MSSLSRWTVLLLTIVLTTYVGSCVLLYSADHFMNLFCIIQASSDYPAIMGLCRCRKIKYAG